MWTTERRPFNMFLASVEQRAMTREMSLPEVAASYPESSIYPAPVLPMWAPHFTYVPPPPTLMHHSGLHGYGYGHAFALPPQRPLTTTNCLGCPVPAAVCRPDHILRQMCMMTKYEECQSNECIDACMEGVDRAMTGRSLVASSGPMARGVCLARNACLHGDDTDAMQRTCSTGALTAADAYWEQVYARK